MTMDLYTTQQSILAYAQAQADFEVIDTLIPEASDGPTDDAGYPVAYCVLRFNDAVKVPQIGAVGGARQDEMYTLVDALCVANTPSEARDLAYGIDGIADILTGFVPTDAGQMTRQSGGQVFVINDGTNTKPTRFVARVSFKLAVNMEMDA